MGFLICEKCGGYYELQKGESKNDFDECECGGKLKFIDNIEDHYNKDKSSTEESIESISKPKEEKKTSSKENINNQLNPLKKIITHYCPECGTKNSEIAVFCKECGKQLQTNKSVPIQKVKSQKTPLNNYDKSYDNSPTMRPLNYIIIGILGIITLILSTSPQNDIYIWLFFPMFIILCAVLAYTLGDIKSLKNGALIGFLVAVPFNLVTAFNFIGSSLISSLIIFILIFGIIGAVAGTIGLYFKRRKLKSIHKIDNFEKTKEIDESKRIKAGIFIIIFFVCLSIIGVVTASPIAMMEHTGNVDGLIVVLQNGNSDDQINALKALRGMDEIQSNYTASGVQSSPYSNKLIPVLVEKMKNSPNSSIRSDAASLFGWGVWNGDENIIKELEAVKNSDPDEYVRSSADFSIKIINQDKEWMNLYNKSS